MLQPYIPCFLAPLRQVVFVLLVAVMALPQTFVSAKAADGEPHHYQIASGSLEDALNNFGQQAGIVLIFSSELTAGKSSNGLRGSYRVEDGLSILLSGTGLRAEKNSDGSYLLQPMPQSSNEAILPTLMVEGQAGGSVGKDSLSIQGTGTTEEGYRTNEVTPVGPWEGRSLQDTPYSITVLSNDWIENAFVRDTGEMAKVTPTMQFSNPTNSADSQAPTIRGFSLAASTLIDGVNLTLPAKAISFEEVERIEVLSGLSGFLYGAGSVGGTINYIIKRPTQEKIRALRWGNYGGEQYFGHIDLGGKIDDSGKFAYRFNAAYQDGETFKDDQYIKRALLSGSLDWQLTEDFLLQFEASHRDNTLDNPNASFRFASGAERPAAFDSSKTYSPEWTTLKNAATRTGVNATFHIDETFDLRMAYKYKKYNAEEAITMYPVMQPDGSFTNPYGFYNNSPSVDKSHAAYVYLDSQFDTGSVQHKMTIGVSGDIYTNERYENSVVLPDSSSYTLDQLNSITAPDFAVIDKGKKYISARKKGVNFIIGDDIAFSERWSALIGFNHATLRSNSYQVSGEDPAGYRKSAISPTVSAIYKPRQDLTTYVTYMEALEEGVIVGAGFTNTDEVLEPLISKQYELGAKYNLNTNVSISSAVFRIEKANQYSDMATPVPTYVQDGLQVNQGIELSVIGKVTENLTLVAGGTLMDLSVEKYIDPMLEGKVPTEKASKLVKLYSEYNFPAVKELTVTGGAYYTGKSYGDRDNTDVIPSYTVFDAGLRYDTEIGNHPAILNLNVANVTNKNYWTNSYYVGNPRSVAFSMKVDF